MNSAARRACTAAFLATTAFLSACASHDPRNQDPVMRTWEQNRVSQLYKLVDANGDGTVTREEFQLHYVPITWLYFDKNGDGYITMSEWAIDGTSRPRVEWFETLDANGDRLVTRIEFEQAMTPEGTDRYFTLMDKNGDGTITVEDLAQS